MQNRKRGYQHVATAVTDGAREDSDEEASLARDDKPARASLSRVSSTAAESGSDFEDDEESGLEDDERLNKQLDLEMAELEKLSAALDSSRRHSPYCLARCFCGTRNSRTISVWFFTFLIFGVVEIVGSIKVRLSAWWAHRTKMRYTRSCLRKLKSAKSLELYGSCSLDRQTVCR